MKKIINQIEILFIINHYLKPIIEEIQLILLDMLDHQLIILIMKIYYLIYINRKKHIMK